MPVCTNCAHPATHLYTTYQTKTNLRLSVCPRCNLFLDPLIEHPPLLLLLDLILLKPRVYLHLLFNRGSLPLDANAKDETPSSASSTLRRRDLQHDLFILASTTLASEAAVRILPLPRQHWWSAIAMSLVEVAAQHLATLLLALLVLRWKGWYPPASSTHAYRSRRDGRQENFSRTHSHPPHAVLHHSSPPSTQPAPVDMVYPDIPRDRPPHFHSAPNTLEFRTSLPRAGERLVHLRPDMGRNETAGGNVFGLRTAGLAADKTVGDKPDRPWGLVRCRTSWEDVGPRHGVQARGRVCLPCNRVVHPLHYHLHLLALEAYLAPRIATMDFAQPTLSDPSLPDPEIRSSSPFSPMDPNELTTAHSLAPPLEEGKKIKKKYSANLGKSTSDEVREALMESRRQDRPAPAPEAVPLPPSPRSQASRRPRGWISTLPNNTGTSPKRLPSARIASMSSTSSRRVSGAMNHAFLHSGSADTSLSDKDYTTALSEAESAGSDDADISFSTPGVTGATSAPGFIGGVDEEDEAWMGYLRHQLGMLFPDFQNGQDVVSTSARWDSGDGSANTEVGEVVYETQGEEGGGVPTFRTEIVGLKDEITRLRDVVGELARGMKKEDKANQGVDRKGEEVPTERVETVQSDEEVPAAFLQTASMSLRLIRTFDSMVHYSEKRSDGEVFDHDNLESLMTFVQTLQDSSTT
ncbi:lipid intermediate transporter, partial [Tremellales sp. Uapishka_1]